MGGSKVIRLSGIARRLFSDAPALDKFIIADINIHKAGQWAIFPSSLSPSAFTFPFSSFLFSLFSSLLI
jgi:hypothetical protein